MSTGGDSGGGQNTVTQSQQIPLFEQQFAQQNQNLAQSLGSQPYPTYQSDLIQGFNPLQTSAQQFAVQAGGSYAPYLGAAQATTEGALNPGGVNAYSGAASNSVNNALGLSSANPSNVASFMSPYIGQALAPQIQDLQLQLAQQQKGIDQQATQANAFGDARQGAAQALQNLYGNQAMNQLIGTGYNNAYSQALQALQGQQGINLSAANTQAGLAGLQGQEQQTQLAGANQLANLGASSQTLGLNAANASYNAGQQQQQLGQSELNAAYQQYLNQVNWPYQQLNVQESALSNSPYNIATAVTLPQANSVAQGFGGLTSAAGLLGGLFGTGSNAAAPFGGQLIQGTH